VRSCPLPSVYGDIGRASTLFGPNITAAQILGSLLAIVAFLPATISTGYLFGWYTNLHNFRQHSLVERMLWSVPLSLSVSTISSVLVGKLFSLNCVVVILLASTAIWIATLGREWLRLRRAGMRWIIGFSPFGKEALAMAFVLIGVVILSIVDLQHGDRLYMSLTTFDHAPRVSWTEAVLRTGVPPVNPFFWFKHSAAMRYYYFWYVVCAAVSKTSQLSVRSVLIASCVWAGFALVALIGLYLKYFLRAGTQLRAQFLRAFALLSVSGIGFCLTVFNLVRGHRSHIEVLSDGQIPSWFNSLVFVPHHIASMVCCMVAFLLAWISESKLTLRQVPTVALIALSLASGFGLSIYVTFAFFLLMAAWAVFQAMVGRNLRPVLLLGIGGSFAVLLLVPYLRELTHNTSNVQKGSVFAFSVREILSSNGLLARHFFEQLSAVHPLVALNLAKLILLIPGYIIELGLYLAVLLVYLIPACRAHTPLDPERRTLVFIAVCTLVLISIVRSGVLEINDFGLRAALLLQFPLLLITSELLPAWSVRRPNGTAATGSVLHRHEGPLRSLLSILLVLGVLTTLSEAIHFRFILPVVEAQHVRAIDDPKAMDLSRDAYISSVGYSQLDSVIPRDAIVQFNPITRLDPFWNLIDEMAVDHQMVIVGDRQGCGSELGGDPRGCPEMARGVDSVFQGGTSEVARTTCRQYGIQFLVVRSFDPAWNDRHSWVWTLKPVVAHDEFRALDCRG